MRDPTKATPPANVADSRLDLFMTVLRVIDWRAQVNWYTETLGLALVLRDEVNQFAFLAAGAGRVGLQGGRKNSSVEGRCKTRLVFQVRDLDGERERLIGRKVEVGLPIENKAEAYREIRLHDPEGNSLTLFAWSDPARSQGEPPGQS